MSAIIYGNIYANFPTNGGTISVPTAGNFYQVPFNEVSPVALNTTSTATGGLYYGTTTTASDTIRITGIASITSVYGYNGDNIAIAIYQNGTQLNLPITTSALSYGLASTISFVVDGLVVCNVNDLFELYFTDMKNNGSTFNVKSASLVLHTVSGGGATGIQGPTGPAGTTSFDRVFAFMGG
jgi:hypothetical protein